MGIVVNDTNWVKGYPVVGGVGVWPMVAKPCDFCKSAPALLFCKPDSAFLCVACDARIHAANKLASKHERLWMCEVCEQVPASVTCKADAAALCVSCDADIHSANPLSRKHERVPLAPFYESAESIIKKSSAVNVSANGSSNNLVNFLVPGVDEDDDQTDDLSWFLPPQKAAVAAMPAEGKGGGAGELIFSDFDHLLEFENPNLVYLNFKNNQHVAGSDSVVPVRIKPEIVSTIRSSDRCFDIDFCKSKLPLYNFDTNSQSINHSVSSSSMDIGLVPDSGGGSDMSYTLAKAINGEARATDNSSAAQATQLTGLDREARVLRYREKRKNRKFEKTIRYASRKAYAETRPRVKGRFVKRTEPDGELDRVFTGGSIDFFEGYSVVPSY